MLHVQNYMYIMYMYKWFLWVWEGESVCRVICAVRPYYSADVINSKNHGKPINLYM